MIRSVRSLFVALLVPVALVLTPACGGGGGGGGGGGNSTPTQSVSSLASFEYRAPTALDPEVNFATCTSKQVLFSVHLHFTWIDWEDRRTMIAVEEDLWTYSDSVPAARMLEVALHDPNNCLEGGVYVAPADLYVNGTRLTTVVDVRQGTGLRFTVAEDGSVTP